MSQKKEPVLCDSETFLIQKLRRFRNFSNSEPVLQNGWVQLHSLVFEKSSIYRDLFRMGRVEIMRRLCRAES